MSSLGKFALRRTGRRTVALLAAAMVLTSCGNWKGIASVPLPGGPGTGADSYTVYVQMPDTLGLDTNSQLRVADVAVGSVKTIELKNWVATLTVQVRGDVKLPANAVARIGQTSLLGSQHLELDDPEDPSPEPLRNGDLIPLQNSSAFPSTERTLASIATILSGGGIPNLEVIQNEVYALLTGRADQIREFLNRLDTFTDELNRQREDLTRAIDSTNRLAAGVAEREETLEKVLTDVPPLIKNLAEDRDLIAESVIALGRISAATAETVTPDFQENLNTNLEALQRPLKQLGRASPFLVGALDVLLTAPFSVKGAPKAIRGDFINTSITADLTLSSIDNGIFSGTGISGFLRALEQAWGRDPATMIPDVRFVPNPNSAPGGPLVERGE